MSSAQTLAEFQAMTPTERHQLLVRWTTNAITSYSSATDEKGQPKTAAKRAADRAIANLTRALFTPGASGDEPFAFLELADRMKTAVKTRSGEPAVTFLSEYVLKWYDAAVDSDVLKRSDAAQLEFLRGVVLDAEIDYWLAEEEHAMLEWYRASATLATPPATEYVALSDSEKMARVRHTLAVARGLRTLMSGVLPTLGGRLAALKQTSQPTVDGFRRWSSKAGLPESSWRTMIIEAPSTGRGSIRGGAIIHHARYNPPAIPASLVRLEFQWLKGVVGKALGESWRGSPSLGTWKKSCGRQSTGTIEIGLYPFASVRLERFLPAAAGPVSDLVIEINCPGE